MKFSICKQLNRKTRGFHKKPNFTPTNQGLDVPAVNVNGKSKKRGLEVLVGSPKSKLNIVIQHKKRATCGKSKAFSQPIGVHPNSSNMLSNVRFTTTRETVTSNQTIANKVPTDEALKQMQTPSTMPRNRRSIFWYFLVR
ncbi:light-independent protochlorophyllide reductase subunit B [Striga asiatica]|uniref:Light-independent protochlorophyllide reductase subunit B n=1 Tax=Striga asiatica TaxID=4170 RepID=A0A5A7RA39_STRAF|nr:light-independent protochlorophyllide reductase subunit B [Striga asiatica]